MDQIADEINEGRSLYTLDACLQLDANGDPTGEGHWIINFRTMLERVSLQLVVAITQPADRERVQLPQTLLHIFYLHFCQTAQTVTL